MSKNNQDFAAKRMARLASVQGLYQISLTKCMPKEVIAHFRENPAAFLHDTVPDTPAASVDIQLFTDVVNGVMDNQTSLDEMLAGALAPKTTVERVENLLRAILRAGVYELHHHAAVPAGIIINDYVDVTHTFFNGKEASLVNGILDKLAKTLRAA